MIASATSWTASSWPMTRSCRISSSRSSFSRSPSCSRADRDAGPARHDLGDLVLGDHLAQQPVPALLGGEVFLLGAQPAFQLGQPAVPQLGGTVEVVVALGLSASAGPARSPGAAPAPGGAPAFGLPLRPHRVGLCAQVAELPAQVLETGHTVAAAGTHPFAQWQDQHLSPGTRYAAIQHNYQQLAREQSIFACHIHVHVADRMEALQIMNHARGWLAILLALTGNSPFFQHTDTGYASYRSQIWARWPFSGPPDYFSSLTEYDDLLNTLLIPNSIENAREVYWDMRLSARFNTLEVRIADVPLSIEETVMLAGLVRALIQTCHALVQQAGTIPLIRQETLRAVHWQAARYGLDATLLDPLTARMIPARQLLTQFLHFVRPALEAQGDWAAVLNTIKTILHTGIGATRQREIYQQTGNLQAVVDFIVQETASGTGAVPTTL